MNIPPQLRRKLIMAITGQCLVMAHEMVREHLQERLPWVLALLSFGVGVRVAIIIVFRCPSLQLFGGWLSMAIIGTTGVRMANGEAVPGPPEMEEIAIGVAAAVSGWLLLFDKQVAGYRAELRAANG